MSEIENWNVISLKYKILKLGQSYEGRDMNVLAITKAGPGAPNIWLEVKISWIWNQQMFTGWNYWPDTNCLKHQAGIHAREWIAPAVATFLVRELVEDYAEHPDYIDKINW